MRSFSNFLLFEDVLSNLPAGSSLLQQAGDLLVNPMVKVVEDDCGTLLGEIMDLDFEKEGLVELATGVPLDRPRIAEILESGKYKVPIRTLHSCIAPGGICRACYEAQYLDRVAPPVNSQTKIDPLLNYQTDIIIGNNYATSFTLTESTDDFDDVIVIKNGLIATAGFTISGNQMIFAVAPTYTDVYVVRFYRETSEPLQGYMARSYSGDLLGMKPLPTLHTPIRESLYSTIISDGFLAMLQTELAPYKAIPSTYIEYIDRIHDKLEKTLFIIYLYAIFANVNV